MARILIIRKHKTNNMKRYYILAFYILLVAGTATAQEETISREAKQKLMRYHWPGNVRELQHAIERAVILSDSSLLKPANFMLQPQPEKKVDTDEILNLEQLEQKSLTLKQQTLQTQYEMNRLTKSFALDKEEYKMGIKSKAQLEVSEDEYNYKLQNSALQMESLRHDSAVTLIRKDLLKNDLEREQKKFTRSLERMNNLVVTAPIAGQLSFVKVTPGQQVASGESIAEIKVLDQYKIHTSLSEYYIDRITTGLPATINYQGKRYPLKITKASSIRAYPIAFIAALFRMIL
jgi:acetyl/propionyl-CoA carboxylase alpha subunit